MQSSLPTHDSPSTAAPLREQNVSLGVVPFSPSVMEIVHDVPVAQAVPNAVQSGVQLPTVGTAFWIGP
jgi:hypothetical protein